MQDYRDAQTCKAKRGLLFLTDCGNVVKDNCTACGRPVCREHCIESEKGSLCLECAASDEKLKAKPKVRMAERRRTYYSTYRYLPYYYGYSHYYSDSDFRTFDDNEMVSFEPPEDATDFYENDDYLES